MNSLRSRFARLIPLAGALSVSLALSTAAEAQAAPGAPAASAAAAAQDLPLTAEQRQQFVGVYVVSMPGAPGRAMPFRVYEEQGALYGQPQGGSAKRLLYQGENRFSAEGEPESVVSFTVEGGKAARFTVATPQGVLEGVREGAAGS
jgi:hypothetical protein